MQISKNGYIDKLDDIVDVKPSTCIDFGIKNNAKDPKFKVSDHLRISKYKNIFAKVYIPNWCEEVFVIKKIKNIVLWIYVFSDLNEEEIVGMLCEKELQKKHQ